MPSNDVVCSRCGGDFGVWSYQYWYTNEDGERSLLCGSCVDREYHRHGCAVHSCASCSEYFHTANLPTWEQFDELMTSAGYASPTNVPNVCPRCFDEGRYLRICDECGEGVIQGDTVHTYTWGTLCRTCYDSHCIICSDCGESFVDDGTDSELCSYCRDYAEEESATHIMGYHATRRRGKFFETDIDESVPRIGTECEVEYDGYADSFKLDNVAGEIIESMPSGLVFCEWDGSLDSGFEIITRPITVDYVNNNSEVFEEMFDILRRNNMSGDSNSCGFHIHMSRTAFGDSMEEHDDTLVKMYAFMEKHYDEFKAISRRTNFGYASRPRIVGNDLLEAAREYYKTRAGYDRSHLNCGNPKTVEFRLPKGVSDINTYLGTINLYDNLVKVCKATEGEKLLEATSVLSVLDNDIAASFVKELVG